MISDDIDSISEPLGQLPCAIFINRLSVNCEVSLYDFVIVISLIYLRNNCNLYLVDGFSDYDM